VKPKVNKDEQILKLVLSTVSHREEHAISKEQLIELAVDSDLISSTSKEYLKKLIPEWVEKCYLSEVENSCGEAKPGRRMKYYIAGPATVEYFNSLKKGK
jgi:hypothetical protein